MRRAVLVFLRCLAHDLLDVDTLIDLMGILGVVEIEMTFVAVDQKIVRIAAAGRQVFDIHLAALEFAVMRDAEAVHHKFDRAALILVGQQVGIFGKFFPEAQKAVLDHTGISAST